MARKNPLFGPGPREEVFGEEEIAGYKITQVRSCRPAYYKVTYEEDGEEKEKKFSSKGKALVWVGKQVKKRPSKNPKGRASSPKRNPTDKNRMAALNKLTSL